MDDDILNLLSVAIEVGLPIALLLVSIAKPKYRYLCLPVLGSLSVPISAYIFIVFGYHFISHEEYEYGYHVVWVMSLTIYCALAILGLILALAIRNYLGGVGKYLSGIALGIVSMFGFMVLS